MLLLRRRYSELAVGLWRWQHQQRRQPGSHLSGGGRLYLTLTIDDGIPDIEQSFEIDVLKPEAAWSATYETCFPQSGEPGGMKAKGLSPTGTGSSEDYQQLNASSGELQFKGSIYSSRYTFHWNWIPMVAVTNLNSSSRYPSI